MNRKKPDSTKKNLSRTCLSTLIVLGLGTESAIATEQSTDTDAIRVLQERVNQLEEALELGLLEQESAIAAQSQTSNNVHFGGYGELHYNHLESAGSDYRQLDLHRMVVFVGYEFNERARFISEIEIEHVLVTGGGRGALELEQAYLEFDVQQSMQAQVGVILVPVGIVNETHEPPTFYGVERPVIELTIIPTTWYVAGTKFSHQFDNGFSYDLMLSEGLKTEDPAVNPSAEPFNLKKGKQKASFAEAFDLAMTARVSYRGIPGLEISTYTQYQPDLDQSAADSYADAANLFGAHVIYQLGQVTTKVLYADWRLDGDAAETAGKNHQYGGYLEVSWKPIEQLGLFVRQSQWSQTAGVDAAQFDIGVNYYPYENIVFKADYQLQNDDAGDLDGFNLGMGYMF